MFEVLMKQLLILGWGESRAAERGGRTGFFAEIAILRDPSENITSSQEIAEAEVVAATMTYVTGIDNIMNVKITCNF